MNRVVKIAAGCLAVVAIVLIGLVLLVKVFVTPERVKAVVLPLAERALQRPVTLGEIRVGLFSGIELRDLAVGEPGETEPFVAAERAVLRFRLLPLLTKRVLIDEVALERPSIRVIRRADGSFSFADLLAAGDESAAAPRSAAGEGEGAFDLFVTTARIRDGRLLFTDRQVGASIELSELVLDAVGISRDGAVPFKVAARLQGAPLKANGLVQPLRKTGKVSLDLQGLDVLGFEPYLRGKIPGTLDRLLLDLRGDFDLHERGIAAKGSLAARELGLRLNALPSAPLRGAEGKADYDLLYEPERDRLELTSLAVALNRLEMRLAGILTELGDAARGELTLTVPGLDLAALGTALPPALLGKAGELALAGTLRGSAALSGPLDQPQRLLRDGEVTLEQVQASVGGVRPTIDGRIALAGETARIVTLNARVGELAAAVAGRIDGLFTTPSADLTVTVPRVELSRALAAAPPDAVKSVSGFAPEGQFEAVARLAGPLAKPEALLKSADLQLAGVKVTAGGQRPEFDGRIKVTGDRLATEGLIMRLGGNTAQLRVTAANLFGKPVNVTADLTAQRFLIEPLLQGGGAAAPPGTAESRTGAAAEPPPLQAAGTVRIGETTWKGLSVRDFVAEYALRDAQLTVGRMTGGIAGGSFSNTARIDLRPAQPAYTAELSLQGVQADPLLTAVAPQAAGTLFGAMSVQASLAGSGTAWEAISRSLSGDAMLTLRDGRLVSPALVQGLATFLQLQNLNEIAFSDFRGRTKIVNGRAELDSTLAGKQLRLFPKGSLGLDGSLDLTMDTRISPELTARIDQRGKATRYLLDADGWSQVPLLVGGTLKAPRFGLDPKGVQAQGTRILQQELQRGLDKLLPKPTPPVQESPPATEEAAPAGQEPPPQPAAPPPATPAQRLLEESLKRVLGR